MSVLGIILIILALPLLIGYAISEKKNRTHPAKQLCG